MNIGIPKERVGGEERVGLTPAGVGLLTRAGHSCYLEGGAGSAAGFDDYDYERNGATIVAGAETLYAKSDLVLKVLRPTPEEIAWMHPGQILMGFLGLMAAPKAELEALVAQKVTLVAYEMITPDGADYPILKTMSEVTGRMAPYIAGTLLMRNHGGRGVLLNGVPGVSAGEVLILGAGTLGVNAARAFLGLGAKVFLLSRSLERLRRLDAQLNGQITTMISHDFNIAHVVRFADVVVGAVRSPGERAPQLINRQMLRTMRRGAVILDFSIDHGGCVETSHPTTLDAPTFIEEDVVHYCVPNVPGAVPRTSTHAFNNAAWPFIQALVESGPATAFAHVQELKRAVIIRNGDIVDEKLDAMLRKS
ncbi:MAG: alanine dehydrogenase [Anaerolineae bacterium]|nr:alanine dehydrogenase [Anaerolineae bacterium]